MQYWNDLVTENSWLKLQDLKKSGLNFVLLGGWAVFLWTKGNKSKDIDIAVSLEELQKIKNKFVLIKNNRLKKYEIHLDEIDVDIYVQFYSKLSLPVEELFKHKTVIEGFNVLKPEALIVLKQGTELARKDSEKGLKDRIDIMELLTKTQIDFKKYLELLEKNNLPEFRRRLIEIIQSFNEIKYLDSNSRELKLAKQKLLKQIMEQKWMDGFLKHFGKLPKAY